MMRDTAFRFRLYIAGDTENSREAVAALNAICNEHLEDRHEIEVVDVFHEPRRALADGVLMTPTLVRLSPAPLRRVVGTLEASAVVLRTLGLESPAR
jgi:circadian clock protein KaiB